MIQRSVRICPGISSQSPWNLKGWMFWTLIKGVQLWFTMNTHFSKTINESRYSGHGGFLQRLGDSDWPGTASSFSWWGQGLLVSREIRQLPITFLNEHVFWRGTWNGHVLIYDSMLAAGQQLWLERRIWTDVDVGVSSGRTGTEGLRPP